MNLRPYSKYKPSGVEWLGRIPEHWEVGRFKHTARLNYGDSLSADARDEGTIPVFGSNGIVGFHSQANTLAPALIIGRKGSYGKINFSIKEAFAIDTTYYIDKTSSTADLRWIFYLFPLLNLDSYSEDSTIPGLSRELAYSQIIPLIDSYEQRSIASFLDRETAKLDTLIAKKERLIELLQEKRTALITKAVTKGLDPTVPMKDSGIEWLGKIPGHWEVSPLKFFADFINGAPFKPTDWLDEGVPIIRIENLNEGQEFNHTIINVDTKYHVKQGDILFGWSGNRGTSFGPFIWKREGLHYLNQHIFRVCNYKADPVYMYWLLKGVTSYVEKQAHGIIGLVHITQGDLGVIPVPKINSKEQRAIAAFLDRETTKIDALIVKVREAIEKFKEYRTALISAAVTGKIDVRGEVN